MVQDNYFLPDVPKNLAANRPKIPVIYGNCRDEWSWFGRSVLYYPNAYRILSDLDFLSSGETTLDQYSKNFFELFFEVTAAYLAAKEVDVMEILENVYAPMGTANDDHLAWFKIQSDVCFMQIIVIEN